MKDAFPAWSPAIWPGGGRRAKATVREVRYLVADVDDGTTPEDALATFPPCRYLVHSSYSHTPAHAKWRLVVPLASPIPADLFPRAWAWLADRLPCLDTACGDASRVYFVPVARPNAFVRVEDGPLLDVDWESLPDVVKRTKPRPPASWAPTKERPTWTPHPADYPPAVVEAAVNRWRTDLALEVAAIEGMARGRRTAIRSVAFAFARLSWLSPLLENELRFSLCAAARDRLDDNILDLIEACLTDADPGPIEDFVPPSTEGVALPLILKRGGSVWVLLGDAYEGPGDSTDAVGWLRERGDVPIATAKGKALPWVDLFRAHGVTAREVAYAYPRPDGSIPTLWEPASRTFTTTQAHAPRVEPQYDDDVAGWLAAALSDADDETRERLLDWLVTAWGDALDRPSATPYLWGESGTGKTMIANAIASPWRSPPVPMGVALSRFNAPLTRCPVVHLDEDQSTAGGAKVESGAFRDLTGSRSQRVEHKFGSIVEVRSAIRGIITANNWLAIEPPAVATLADLDAIAERILFVPWSSSAAKYLAKLFIAGRSTAGWVTADDGGPGKIARHVEALRATREVTPGVRWVVAGVVSDYHRSFLTRATDVRDVLDAITASLAHDATQGTSVRWYDGNVAVYLSGLAADWARLAPGARRYARQELRNALESLSRGTANDGTWTVDGDVVRQYAKSVAIRLRPGTPAKP